MHEVLADKVIIHNGKKYKVVSVLDNDYVLVIESDAVFPATPLVLNGWMDILKNQKL